MACFYLLPVSTDCMHCNAIHSNRSYSPNIWPFTRSMCKGLNAYSALHFIRTHCLQNDCSQQFASTASYALSPSSFHEAFCLYSTENFLSFFILMQRLASTASDMSSPYVFHATACLYSMNISSPSSLRKAAGPYSIECVFVSFISCSSSPL